jgi:hypothetical protein
MVTAVVLHGPPPRLPEQPIFYPVLNEEYAPMIARDWNVKQSGTGYVTRFSLPSVTSQWDSSARPATTASPLPSAKPNTTTPCS